MFNLYHPNDPAAKQMERWTWVYLDGAAERHNEAQQIANGWEWDAPDLCVIDHPSPETIKPGTYECCLYGKCAIATLAIRYSGGTVDGRVALKEEPERVEFNKTPSNWR